MKRIGYRLFPVLAITLMLVGSAFAQDFSDFFVTYYSNANTTGAPDGTLRIVNDGVTDVDSINVYGLYADIYVFDDSEEMQDCCSCFISPDGILSESVNKQLANPNIELTGRAEINRGVIKVISDVFGNPTGAFAWAGLRGYMTHVQATSTTVGATKPWPSKGVAPFYVSEDALADSNLSNSELNALEESCSLAITLGSGFGVCTCTPEDHDF